MLQTNCPHCREVIRSPYLNDLLTIECEQCKEVVTVEDVFVATNEFTIHRDDLLNRISRFQRLLGEVEKEKALMAKDIEVSEKTKKSVERFYRTLQELLEGARSNFRLEIPCGLAVQVGTDKKNTGKLINLSSEGASLECEVFDKLPRAKEKIELQLTLPEAAEALSASAKVVWVRKPKKDAETQSCSIGVKFIDLDESVRANIWDFIVETVSKQSPARSA